MNYKILAQAALEKRSALVEEVRTIQAGTLSDTEKRAKIDALNVKIQDAEAEAREAVEAGEREAETRSIARGSGLGRRPVDGPASESRSGLWLASELRALNGSGNTGGGAWTPPDHPSYFFDRLAPASVLLSSGVRVVRTDKDSVVVPHVVADTSAAWTAEGAAIVSTDAQADQIVATPRKIASLQALSNEAVDDADPDLLEGVAKGMIRAVALKFDLGAFEGSGTGNEIRGLRNVAGIQTVSMGTNGAAPTNLDMIADALGLLQQANTEGAAIVMHPRTLQSLSKVKEGTGSTKPLLQESYGSGGQAISRSIYGVPVYVSSQLSITETQGTANNASSIYVYAPSEVVAVVRSEARVELDRSRLFNSDQSEVRVIWRGDIVVPNPAAVVRISGVTP